MNSLILRGAVAGLLFFAAGVGSASDFPDPVVDNRDAVKGKQTAVLSGGCFWCVEVVYQQIAGVEKVVSGYSGGEESTARYDLVSKGNTGHAESVQITYDPRKVSYGQLLKVFFHVAHDPTQLNRQGPDRGTQYRSAIFYSTPEQKKIAEAYISQLEDAKAFRGPMVTQVVPLKAFYPAEEHHQNFCSRNPQNPYVMSVAMPESREGEKGSAGSLEKAVTETSPACGSLPGMRYRVAFTKRVQADGNDSDMRPSAELDENLPEGVIAEKLFVEQFETEAQHSQEVLDEDDDFLASAAPEVWEYEIVDSRVAEFEEALRGSDLVLEFDVIDDTPTDRSEASLDPLDDRGVFPADGTVAAPSGKDGIEDLNEMKANDPRLGLTNRGNKPAEDWAADTGPSRNPVETLK